MPDANGSFQCDVLLEGVKFRMEERDHTLRVFAPGVPEPIRKVQVDPELRRRLYSPSEWRRSVENGGSFLSGDMLDINLLLTALSMDKKHDKTVGLVTEMLENLGARLVDRFLRVKLKNKRSYVVECDENGIWVDEPPDSKTPQPEFVKTPTAVFEHTSRIVDNVGHG